MRKHSNFFDVDLSPISVIKNDFDHVLLHRDVQLFDGGREEAVVNLGPEHADASTVGKLVLGLGLDVEDLKVINKFE